MHKKVLTYNTCALLDRKSRPEYNGSIFSQNGKEVRGLPEKTGYERR